MQKTLKMIRLYLCANITFSPPLKAHDYPSEFEIFVVLWSCGVHYSSVKVTSCRLEDSSTFSPQSHVL